MINIVKLMSIVSIVFCGSIFGFFYAWVCSTMWGLDAADPRTAIAAMQAMNASVRNVVFSPSFFGTPLVLALTAGVCWLSQSKASAGLFALACVTYFFGGLLLTVAVNVPMNEELAKVLIPESIEDARVIWDAYSVKWQLWNQLRTYASCLALVFAALGAMAVNPHTSN